jgi:rhamnulokinase
MLFMPDLFNYLLSGEKVSEYTIASTSQMLNARQRSWDKKLLNNLDLPDKILPEIVEPGSVIGQLKPEIQNAAGLPPADVIAVGAHDTASAVAAVPVTGKDSAYLSSGTWSLLGIESPEPIINRASYEYGFTNEGGVKKDYRFLKNTTGLWLLQQCRKSWKKQDAFYEYSELVQMAEKAEPFFALIDPDDKIFLNPPDMPQAIAEICRKTNQAAPQDPGQFTRIILESLALKYRYILEKINKVAGNQVKILHIVGGGSQNKLLNQFAANALGIPVITGPVEATAIGNILVQLIAKGVISNLDEGREMVKKSFNQDEFQPQNKDRWNDAFAKAEKIFS